MPKKKDSYVDAKIYQHKIKDDSERRTVGVNFANMRLKTTSKLVLDDTKSKSHHQHQGYLIRELAKTLGRLLPKDLCLSEPTATVNGESIRVEFPTPAADTNKAKRETRAILEQVFSLNVKII